MINSYEDLEIYKRSYKLALKIHERTKKFPEEEGYDITSQIRRCSKSIPTNIAEEYGRQSRDEFKRFARISLGSCNEVGKMLNVSIQRWK